MASELQNEVMDLKRRALIIQEQWQDLMKLKRSIEKTDAFLRHVETSFEELRQMYEHKPNTTELRKIETYMRVLEKKVIELQDTLNELIRKKRLRKLSKSLINTNS